MMSPQPSYFRSKIMLLTIDAGNTRIKWGLFNREGEMLTHGACFHDELSTTQFPEASRVIISNVAGAKIKAKLEKKLAVSSPIYWIKSQALACGVTNHYEKPEALGTDRWAALIAAWHIKQAPCVVVNAGTAITIDALSVNQQSNQAEFIGGLILPGLKLMQQSLSIATAQLPMPDEANKITGQYIFAKTTNEAIYLGALHAISGAIIQMVNGLQTQCHQAPLVVMSGGNAQIIHNSLKGCMTNAIVIVDNLVLRGLYLLDQLELK